MVRAHSTVLLVLLVAAAFAPPAASATAAPVAPRASAHWLQIEQRIENGYHEQNAQGLEAMAASLSGSQVPAQGGTRREEWRSYYAALVAYRLVLLSKDDEAQAWLYTGRCIERLNQALVLDPGSAEALALQSACLALQSRLDPWRSPLAAPLSIARIDKALRLAPDNPRVLLLGAEAAGDRPKLFGGDSQQAFALLKRAVAAFEAPGVRARNPPAWGAADALTGLAQDYLARGDALAARNVLERALLVAPDFGQARRLMARIVSG
jgi:tetratricopeptide (TPR) repeat protein